MFGALFVTPMVLMPAMLQQLRDFPEVTVGTLIAARGAGTILSMLIMIAFANTWDPRLLFLIGFGMHTYAGVDMAQFDLHLRLSVLAKGDVGPLVAIVGDAEQDTWLTFQEAYGEIWNRHVR